MALMIRSYIYTLLIYTLWYEFLHDFDAQSDFGNFFVTTNLLSWTILILGMLLVSANHSVCSLYIALILYIGLSGWKLLALEDFKMNKVMTSKSELGPRAIFKIAKRETKDKNKLKIDSIEYHHI